MPIIPETLANFTSMTPRVELQDRYDNTMSQGLRDILEDMEKARNQMHQMMVSLIVNLSLKQRPFQDSQVSATNTEASDDPDGTPVPRSVLTTASKTENEFNWHRAGGLRTYKIIMGPGDGIHTHHVIIDRDAANQNIQRWKADSGSIVATQENVCRPYGAAGTKLQFGYYQADGDTLKFWPTSLAIDNFYYLEQDLPEVEYAI